VGLVGGAPKCLKTWISLEMAVSVATGTPCFDQYAVHEQGPALVYLAEDSMPMVRERLNALATHRALDLKALSIYVITAPHMRLDLARDQIRLMKTARQLKPRILVLDPLVRLHNLNENDASEVSTLLSFLRNLQRELDLAVAVVHHTRKNTSSCYQGGQGLRGSGDFHAWSDSSIYLRQSRGELILSTEHRSAPAMASISIELVVEGSGPPYLLTKVPSPTTPQETTESLELRLLAALSKDNSLTRNALRKEMRIKNERLGELLNRLEQQQKIVRYADGWRLDGRSDDAVPAFPYKG
jgi:hypothetical protein